MLKVISNITKDISRHNQFQDLVQGSGSTEGASHWDSITKMNSRHGVCQHKKHMAQNMTTRRKIQMLKVISNITKDISRCIQFQESTQGSKSTDETPTTNKRDCWQNPEI